MKTSETIQDEASTPHIDNILATEDALIPSSGFLASVMERVREEAAAPPPIPFPWKRTIPGVVFIIGALAWIILELIRRGLPTVSSPQLIIPQITPAIEHSLEQAGWVALALGVSLFSWLLSRRLAGRSGLL
jgi:hypothetical protein